VKPTHTLASLGVFGLFLLAWELLPPAFGVPRYIIPTASQTWNELLVMIPRHNLIRHFTSTLTMAALGFVIGSLFGAIAGYLLGMSSFWERVLSPYLLALQIAPKVAFAPLFIMWFGYTAWPKLLVTVLIVFFPILVNVLQAMRH
jgi:NitT/TauT family transport system permease protein